MAEDIIGTPPVSVANISVFDALLIGSGVVAAVVLKTGIIEIVTLKNKLNL